MGLGPVEAILLGQIGRSLAIDKYKDRRALKTQDRSLRNRMSTLENLGIHPLAAAGFGGGSFSGTGGSNIGHMAETALDREEKLRKMDREDEMFDLNKRHMESQIETQIAIASKTQAETAALEADTRSPPAMIIQDDIAKIDQQLLEAVTPDQRKALIIKKNRLKAQLSRATWIQNSLANEIE